MADIKTSKRTYTWTVQKFQGGRWRMLVDSQGPILFPTRSIARGISRELQNKASKTPRSYRVVKLTPNP